jgi:cephalosporin hydroxylase
MTASVCWSNPKYIFDWGTNTGKSARIFYEIKKYFGLNAKIVTIDLLDDQEHSEHPGKLRGKFVKGIKEVKLIQGDGIVEALKICNKRKVSKAFFFLDGDHSYKSIKRELNLIHKNINSPTMLVHDTFFQSEKSKYNIGPHKAVKEFQNNTGYKSIETKLGLPGMTLIYKVI